MLYLVVPSAKKNLGFKTVYYMLLQWRR